MASIILKTGEPANGNPFTSQVVAPVMRIPHVVRGLLLLGNWILRCSQNLLI